MPHHIPIPVEVAVKLADIPRGKFHVYPEAMYTSDGLEITGWTIMDEEEDQRGRYDMLLTSVMSRKVLHEVCRITFESEICPAVNLQLIIGDEKRYFPMRAVEKEEETVEYEISIEGEWLAMIDVFVGDVLDEDFLRFAELEARPSIDFGHDESVYSEMA